MEQSEGIKPFNFKCHDEVGHTVVVKETGMGMSVFPHMLTEQSKDGSTVAVFDVGPTSRSLVSLMRDGRKVNTNGVSVGKNEPYYRQYDKRK